MPGECDDLDIRSEFPDKQNVEQKWKIIIDEKIHLSVTYSCRLYSK
jgi:hypothetical protein